MAGDRRHEDHGRCPRRRCGRAAWVSAYGARTLTRHCRSNSSSGASENGFGVEDPRRVDDHVQGAEGLERLRDDPRGRVVGSQVDGDDVMLAAAGGALAQARRRRGRRARPSRPPAPSPAAIAIPMPELAPVTIATLPSRPNDGASLTERPEGAPSRRRRQRATRRAPPARRRRRRPSVHARR